MRSEKISSGFANWVLQENLACRVFLYPRSCFGTRRTAWLALKIGKLICDVLRRISLRGLKILLYCIHTVRSLQSHRLLIPHIPNLYLFHQLPWRTKLVFSNPIIWNVSTSSQRHNHKYLRHLSHHPARYRLFLKWRWLCKGTWIQRSQGNLMDIQTRRASVSSA